MSDPARSRASCVSRGSGGDAVEDALQSLLHLLRHGTDITIARDLELCHRIDRGHHALRGVVGGVHDDVARQQQSDVRLGGERLMGQGGLQAPRMMYGLNSTSSFFFMVALTSISVRIPNPSFESSSRAFSTAAS